MNRLDEMSVEKILPSSISIDKNIRNICRVLNQHLEQVTHDIAYTLVLSRLDDLPEKLVDELAWQFHVDFYDYSYDIEKKRNLVRQAIALHKKKGTPAAIEDASAWVFKSAVVQENWEYGGKPYHFRLCRIKDNLASGDMIDRLITFINEYKNVRSWLDELNFYRELRLKCCFCSFLETSRVTHIYPLKFTLNSLTGIPKHAMPVGLQRKAVIK